jgi:histidine triad (HIT) family protein
MAGIFSRIISGEIPCYKVAEDEFHIAFLDINPVAFGHVLVVPKRETDYVFDIEDPEYLLLWSFVKIVARGLKVAVPCRKVGISVIGLEVPHAHVHLVPLNEMQDINFSKPKLSPDASDLELVRRKISESILSSSS